MPTDRCEPLVDDDGTVIATVHGQHPMSAEAQDAMRALVAAAVAHHEARPDRAEMDARQDASRARIRERNARLLAPCCDMHNTHCEPPGDLCCYRCTEIHHGVHTCSDRLGLVVIGHCGTPCVLTTETPDA